MRGVSFARWVFLTTSLLAFGCGDGKLQERDVPGDQVVDVECILPELGSCRAAGALIDFGEQRIAGRAERTILLRNESEGSIRIDELERGELPAAFDHSLLCGEEGCGYRELAGGAELEVKVSFKPSAEGVVEGRLNHPAIGSIGLRGVGASAPIHCDTEAAFGKILVGKTATRTISCTNDGVAAEVVQAELKGEHADDFSLVGASTQKAHPGSTISFKVQAAPSEPGLRSATLELSSGGELQGAAALATEALDHPIAFADPGCIDFGFTRVGSTRARGIILQNVSDTTVQLDLSTDGAAFAIRTGVTSIPAGAQAEVEVDFTPPAVGLAEGALHVDALPGSTRTSLCIKGTGGGPELLCDIASVDFGHTIVGGANAATIECSNVGDDVPGTDEDNLQVSLSALSAPFAASVVGGIPAAGWAPGDSFEILVTYSPAAVGPDQALLEIESNDVLDAQRQISLSGEGFAYANCDLELSATELDFGSVWRDRMELPLILRNVGQDACVVADLEVSAGAPFSVSNAGAIVIPAGEEAAVDVSFETAGVNGAALGELSFFVNQAGASQRQVDLRGVAAASCIKVRPGALDFGTIALGCGGNSLDLRLVNDCEVDVDILSSQLDSPTGFEIVGATPVLVPARRTEILSVQPTAGGAGNRQALLSIETDRHGTFVVPLQASASPNATASDEFAAKTGPVDILIIQDNSASTPSWLWLHPETFAQEAAARDFHIGVTTTGLAPTGVAGCGGGVKGGEDGRLFPVDGSSPRIITTAMTPAEQAATLEYNSLVGDCHASEYGLEAMRRALSPPLIDHADDPRHPEANDGNLGFLREEADLEVLVHSDEADQSGALLPFVEFLRGRKDDPSRARLHAIVGDAPGGCAGVLPGGGNIAASAGAGFIQVAEATDGVFHSYCSARPEPWFNEALIEGLYGRRCYDLRGLPEDVDGDGTRDDEIQVLADGMNLPFNGAFPWTYEPLGNRVCFTTDARPARTADIEIRYTPACAP